MLDAVRLLEADKRGGGRRAVFSADASRAELLDALGAGGPTASRVAATREAVAALEAAVESLPPLQREVVRKYDLEGMSVEEVAGAVGKSTGAVFMLRARAHRALCERMGTVSRYLSGAGHA